MRNINFEEIGDPVINDANFLIIFLGGIEKLGVSFKIIGDISKNSY